MGSYKTAAPCEVCGFRLSHSGSNKGFLVGYTAKAIPRLVHESCRAKWIEHKDSIMASWLELRPKVLATLHPTLRHRIERCLAASRGATMSRPRSHEPFAFPPALSEWLKKPLSKEARRKGDIKNWFSHLQREHPTWMPKTHTNSDYQDFYRLVVEIEREVQWRRGLPVPPTPASPETPVPASASSTPAADDGDDLTVMGRAAHALIDLAMKRRDREAVQLALEAMAHLLKPPAPSSTTTS